MTSVSPTEKDGPPALGDLVWLRRWQKPQNRNRLLHRILTPKNYKTLVSVVAIIFYSSDGICLQIAKRRDDFDFSYHHLAPQRNFCLWTKDRDVSG